MASYSGDVCICIEVKDLPDGVNEEELETYFSSILSSGGREVERVTLSKTQHSAIIQFKHPEAVNIVQQKRPLFMRDKKISIDRYNKPNEADDFSEQPCVVRVKGLPSDLPEEYLQLYFENPKHGGGDVESIEYRQNGIVLITFTDSEVAERVISWPRHQICNREIKVSRWRKPDKKTIHVSGFKQPIDGDILKMFFESEKNSGGGEIRDVQMVEETVALVTFVEEAVCHRVLRRTQLKLGGYELCVSLWEEEEDVIYEESRTVLVTGVHPDTPEEMIRWLFENKKKSNGGDVEEIRRTEDGNVLITFKFKEVAHRVIDYGKTEQLLLEKNRLYVSLWVSKSKGHTVTESEEVNIVDTIQVIGNIDKISMETLTLYFESSRRSGGGEISRLSREDNSRLLISFIDPQVVSAVLSKGEHQVEGEKLEVTVCNPQPANFIDCHKFFIEGAWSETTDECLNMYIQNKCGHEPKRIVTGERPGTFMLLFEKDVDLLQLKEACEKQPLEDCYLTVSAVPISKCIRVTNISPTTSHDALLYYFENPKKSGGGAVSNVQLFKEEGYALVQFADHQDVDKVLVRQHSLGKHSLSLTVHYDCLGLVSLDGTELPLIVPGPLNVPIHQCLLEFFLKSRSDQQALEQQLSQYTSRIDWSQCRDQVLMVVCKLDKSEKNRRQLMTWKTTVSSVVKEYLDMFKVEEVSCLQETWSSIKEGMKSTDFDLKEGRLILENDETKTVVVVGHRLIVEQGKDAVEKLKLTIEQDIEHQKKVIKEVKKLEPFQMLFLKLQKLQETVEAKHPRMGVKLNFQLNNIEFSGLPTEIADAKVAMYEEIQIMENTKYALSPGICDLLQSSVPVKDFIASQFKEKGVEAVWDIKGTDVIVYAATDKHIVEGAQLITSKLVEAIVKIKRESAQLLLSEEWQKTVQGLEKKFQGLLNIIPAADKSQVTIVTTSDIIAHAKEAIQTFLHTNTILAELTQLDCGRAHFMRRYKKAEILSLEKSLQEHRVSIKINIKSDPPGMQVRGTEMGIQQAKLKLEEITRKVSTRRYHVQKPGFTKYLQSEKGTAFLENVETQYEVIIRESSEQDASVIEDIVMVSKRIPQGPTIRAFVTLPQNRKVLVVNGDITSYKVDAIVNDARRNLKHNRGLAGAIVSKGGRSIQEESDAYVKEHGLLLEGNVAVTSAGSLPCTAIIHAVGPVWKGGQNREEELLNEAVFVSIEAAANLSMRSIAIPALSTGIYDYPLTSAANTITEAVESYFKEEPNSSIQEVHLVDISDQTVNQFVSALTNLFGRDKVHEVGGKPAASSRTNLKWKINNGDHALGKCSLKVNSTDVETRSGLQICLVKGELAKQKADVLVNSTSTEMALNNGSVSKSLLTAAGTGMQKEAKTLYPKGFQTKGEVLVTKGHKLSCKEVYHGSLPIWKLGIAKPAEGLEQFMLSCLKKAHDSGYSTITFPALGCGNLRYPDAAVAKSMYETVVNFSDSTPNSSLKTVSFVVFPGSPSTVKAFEDHKTKLSGKPRAVGLSSTRRRTRTFNDQTMEEKGRPFQPGPVREEEIFPLKSINFVISQGDITQVSTDAIVNSTNDRLDLTIGAVSAAILRAAGSQIQKECGPLVTTMMKKGLVVTGPGNLKCKHIIHMDARSHNSWKAKMMMCLEAANARGALSVAFPAVGTGEVKKDPEKIAQRMFEAISEFQSNHKSGVSITDVRLVVFEETMVSSIKAGLRKCFAKTGAAPKSWWRSIVSGVTGLFSGDYGIGGSYGEVRNSPKEIALVIISDQEKAIDGAMKRIETVMKEEIQDRVIEGSWSESIKNLSDRHIAEIRQCECDQDVKLRIERRLGRIRIQGMPADVLAAFEKTTDILRQTDRMVSQAQTSEFVKSLVQWCYLDTGSDTGNPTLVEYDKTLNMMLEKAFLAKERLKEVMADNGDKYCYNFDTMEEYPEDDPNDKVKLIRKEVNTLGARFEPPPTWSQMADKDLLAVELHSTDNEYQTVVTNLHVQGHISNIIKIERIQNRSLYEQYMAKKGTIEKANPAKSAERILWHGTSYDTIQSINKYGFNRSYCGKNATAFGNGVYFSVNAQYSANNTYARPDAAGHKRIYQTKVLVGEYTQGQKGMIVPPAKSGHILYDSVVDRPGNPGMFIIFHDAQAYPEYLITFN